jgi:hypothetical protein
MCAKVHAAKSVRGRILYTQNGQPAAKLSFRAMRGGFYDSVLLWHNKTEEEKGDGKRISRPGSSNRINKADDFIDITFYAHENEAWAEATYDRVFEGKEVTAIEINPRGSIRWTVMVDKKTGWPVASESTNSVQPGKVGLARFVDLEINPPMKTSQFRFK